MRLAALLPQAAASRGAECLTAWHAVGVSTRQERAACRVEERMQGRRVVTGGTKRRAGQNMGMARKGKRGDGRRTRLVSIHTQGICTRRVV